MAKYKSLVELSGTIGDLVFYNLNGIPVVRRKSGFSKEAFNTNPNYQKVRENSSEFGHCSKSGKLLRSALEPFIGDYEDKYLYQKFAKIMTQIKDLDAVNSKGKRRIEQGFAHQKAHDLLNNFQFGKYETPQNIHFGQSFFTKTVQLKEKTEAETIQLVTIKPNFELLEVEIKEETIKIDHKKGIHHFEAHFQDNNQLLLYFLILRQENTIKNAGFIS